MLLYAANTAGSSVLQKALFVVYLFPRVFPKTTHIVFVLHLTSPLYRRRHGYVTFDCLSARLSGALMSSASHEFLPHLDSNGKTHYAPLRLYHCHVVVMPFAHLRMCCLLFCFLRRFQPQVHSVPHASSTLYGVVQPLQSLCRSPFSLTSYTDFPCHRQIPLELGSPEWRPSRSRAGSGWSLLFTSTTLHITCLELLAALRSLLSFLAVLGD